ncbi:uncharacterized protein stai isoform X2 [Palaemon carinicauda]|uniref:uncharacterized protein stai isoform X2 n=2 Tax=Palaemon carinicauda TaxID=392227 RepID=UPI0035B60FFB
MREGPLVQVVSFSRSLRVDVKYCYPGQSTMAPVESIGEKSTEIRCEEKSRGGMCYEVILAEPSTDKPAPVATSPRPKSMTAEEIAQKLVLAEERRKSMEASRLASVNERMSRLEDASRKREEANKQFIATTQAALEDKLDTSSNNRKAYLNGLRAKITDHLNNVDGVRKSLDEQTIELRDAIEVKMKSAEENRNENLNKMLEKLKDHEDYARKVRLSHEEAIRQLEERIQEKLAGAEAKREKVIMKKLEPLREHSNKINEAQQIIMKKEEEYKNKKEEDIAQYEERLRKLSLEKEAKRQDVSKTLSEKIEQAQEYRSKEEEELKKKTQEKIALRLETADKIRSELEEKARKAKEEQERRAEIVRANKERIIAAEAETSEDTSSG